MLSGKEDPEWTADAAFAKEVLDYCKNAGPWEQDWEIPSILGYNGVVFYNTKTTITAFRSQMQIKTDDKVEIKTDLGRGLEIMVLKNAPEEFKGIALQQLTRDFD